MKIAFLSFAVGVLVTLVVSALWIVSLWGPIPQ